MEVRVLCQEFRISGPLFRVKRLRGTGLEYRAKVLALGEHRAAAGAALGVARLGRLFVAPHAYYVSLDVVYRAWGLGFRV